MAPKRKCSLSKQVRPPYSRLSENDFSSLSAMALRMMIGQVPYCLLLHFRKIYLYLELSSAKEVVLIFHLMRSGFGEWTNIKSEVLSMAGPWLILFIIFNLIKRYELAPHHVRWAEVRAAIEKSGTYDLTEIELNYGAKLAWRNAPRCIGRGQWSKLQVTILICFIIPMLCYKYQFTWFNCNGEHA